MPKINLKIIKLNFKRLQLALKMQKVDFLRHWDTLIHWDHYKKHPAQTNKPVGCFLSLYNTVNANTDCQGRTDLGGSEMHNLPKWMDGGSRWVPASAVKKLLHKTFAHSPPRCCTSAQKKPLLCMSWPSCCLLYYYHLPPF